jgi:hypothetical protein
MDFLTREEIEGTQRRVRREATPLVGSQLVADSLAQAVMTGQSVGTRTAGLAGTGLAAAALAALNTMSGGSYTAAQIAGLEPNYAAPRSDTVYRIVGNFRAYNNDPVGQHVGHFISGRTDALPIGGATGSTGQISVSFPDRYLVMVMRDFPGSTQKVRFWASKAGGPIKPFRAITDQDGNEQFATSSSDGLYWVVPIDLGATGPWTITMDFDLGTFGGFYTIGAASTLTYPTIPVPRGLIIGDSFSVPGQGQFSSSLGFVPQLARTLGMEWHVSGNGGTGICARNGSPGTSLNYLERLPYDVDPYFTDTDPPAVIVVQGSQNDRTYGFAGTSALDTNIAALCSGLRGRFPRTPMFITGIMHTHTETWNSEYFQIEDQILAFLAAHPDLNITYVPGLLRSGIAYGSGYMGHATGDGPSDTMTWTDSSHASPITQSPSGAGTIAAQIASIAAGARARVWMQATGLARAPTGASQAVTLGQIVGERRRIPERNGILTAGGANAYVIGPASVVQVGQPGSAIGAFPIDPADHAIAGYTAKLRVKVVLGVNGTAPACNFLVGLYSGAGMTNANGDASINAGTLVTGASLTITTPALQSRTFQSVTVNLSLLSASAFNYVAITPSAAMAANSSVFAHVEVDVYYV